jgi:hypothetical protein
MEMEIKWRKRQGCSVLTVDIRSTSVGTDKHRLQLSKHGPERALELPRVRARQLRDERLEKPASKPTTTNCIARVVQANAYSTCEMWCDSEMQEECHEKRKRQGQEVIVIVIVKVIVIVIVIVKVIVIVIVKVKVKVKVRKMFCDCEHNEKRKRQGQEDVLRL